MNKKIKSLIIAGALVVSQSVTTFAMETNQFEGNDSNHGTHQHEVGNGLVQQKLDTGAPGVHYLTDENGNNVIEITISEDGKVADVKAVEIDGVALVEIKFIHIKGANAFNCYVLDEGMMGATGLTSPLKNGKIPEISHITVVYNVKGDTPVVPPTEPENPDVPVVPEQPDTPNQVPGTGDISVLPMVGLGSVSAVGLLLANKKKRK